MRKIDLKHQKLSLKVAFLQDIKHVKRNIRVMAYFPECISHMYRSELIVLID